jgi:hypothetical protein
LKSLQKSLFKFILVWLQFKFSSKYLNPLILNPKTLFKIKNSFCSPFTFQPASSLWPALLFLGTGPLRSAFRPKPAHPRPSPFLLPLA